jgi:hypothetical protein
METRIEDEEGDKDIERPGYNCFGHSSLERYGWRPLPPKRLMAKKKNIFDYVSCYS